jgi:hypothetical protein
MNAMADNRPVTFLCSGTFTPKEDGSLHAVIKVEEWLAPELPRIRFAYVRFGVEYNGEATTRAAPPDENGVMRYTLFMHPVGCGVPFVPGMERETTTDTAMGFASHA